MQKGRGRLSHPPSRSVNKITYVGYHYNGRPRDKEPKLLIASNLLLVYVINNERQTMDTYGQNREVLIYLF